MHDADAAGHQVVVEALQPGRRCRGSCAARSTSRGAAGPGRCSSRCPATSACARPRWTPTDRPARVCARAPPPTPSRRWPTRSAASRRPVILAGSGAWTADAGAALRAVAERIGAGVLTTPGGRGSFPEEHALSLGQIGPLLHERRPRGVGSDADLVLSRRLAAGGAAGRPGREPLPGRRALRADRRRPVRDRAQRRARRRPASATPRWRWRTCRGARARGAGPDARARGGPRARRPEGAEAAEVERRAGRPPRARVRRPARSA